MPTSSRMVVTARIADETAPDDEPRDLKVTIEILDDGILIGFDGYGTYATPPGHGFPVGITCYDGFPRVVVWSDINQMDWTHEIVLDGAADSKRKKYDDEPTG